MTTLYIIGNGFDLWHGLPTDYGSFYAYAKDMLDEMEAYYISGSHLDRPWHNFERCLGTYDWQLFYDAYNNVDVMSEDFRRSQAYSLEDELTAESESHVESVRNLFCEWISEIDVSVASAKFQFNQGASFLTFNYTNTLQSVYGVPESRILHIHGSAAAYDELVFGHGETMVEEPELDENGDSNRTMFTDAQGAAKYPFYAFQKPVVEMLKKHQVYFSSLSRVSEVVVMGHSINDVDLAYFMEVSQRAKGSCWVVYCYKKSEAEHYVRQLGRCGVPEDLIEIRAYQ